MNPRRLLSQAALLIGALAFSTGLQAFAFTAPSTAPPNADAYAPLSTSPTAQSKQGGLLLNTGGATNGLIVQSGNVGIGTASPSQQLDVAGYVKGSGLCIGSDCRTSWPSSSSYSAGPGISISGATISNTGVVSESDPTVQSWAKISTGSAWVGYKWVPNGAQISCSPDGQGGQYATAYLRNNNGTLEIRGVVSGPEPRMSCDTGWVTGFHAYCLSTLGGWSIDAAENTPVQSLNSNLQYIHSLGAATLIGNGGTCFVDW